MIVTGGSRGIGRAIVERFAADGAEVTFFYRGNAAAAAEVVEAGTRRGRKVTAEQVDVTDAPAVTAAVERLVDARGPIDVLVNNAGVIRDNLLAMLDDDDVRAVLDTNVGGVFNVTRAVVPHMIARRAGKIVNLSSVVGREGRSRPDELRREQGRDQRLHARARGRARAAQDHGELRGAGRDRDRDVAGRSATWPATK